MNLNDMGHRRMRPNHQEHHHNNDREPSEASARLPQRNRPNEEEKFGKLKFQIPPFKGDVDPEGSEERRVGKEGLRLCRSRWSPYH